MILVERSTLMNEFPKRSKLRWRQCALSCLHLGFRYRAVRTRVHSQGEHEKVIRFCLPGIRNTLRRGTEAARRGTDRVLAGRCITPSKDERSGDASEVFRYDCCELRRL